MEPSGVGMMWGDGDGSVVRVRVTGQALWHFGRGVYESIVCVGVWPGARRSRCLATAQRVPVVLDPCGPTLASL